MKIAVLGAGISGLGAAYLLSKKFEVDLYEKEARLGGHARTTMVEEEGRRFGVDTGFLVFNHETYPLLTRLFETLDVAIEKSDMSFGFWDEASGTAYNGQSLGGMFFQKRNLFSPMHWRMIRDILRFNRRANADIDRDAVGPEVTLGAYLRPYGDTFKQRYLIPMGAAIWSTPNEKMHDFPARTFLHFFKNHGLLGVTTQHQWLTVSSGSVQYVDKIKTHVSGRIVTGSDVIGVRRCDGGVLLRHANGAQSHYDRVVMAMHAPDALKMLEDPSDAEREVLGAFAYKENNAVLHNDTRALYPDRGIYAAWNYKTGGNADAVTLSYWINRLQNLDGDRDYFVSLNETAELENVIERIRYSHPLFDRRAIAAQKRRDEISGVRNTYYAGAYWRYGFHEDGLWSADTIARTMGCGL